jgi:hypothetical protein
MDELIDLLAKLDWFEALDAGVRRLSGVKSREFAVSRNCGWSGQQIESMLRQYGVKVWGRGFTHDTLTFQVSVKQANWAEYLLHQHAIPVFSRPLNPKNRDYAKRDYFNTSDPQHRKRSSWLESLISALCDIL